VLIDTISGMNLGRQIMVNVRALQAIIDEIVDLRAEIQKLKRK